LIIDPLIDGTLIKRYKRFLADIELLDGNIITAHCPNTGSMKQCVTPGSPVKISYNPNPKRKYHYTWQYIKIKCNWCCVNTILANKLAGEAIREYRIPALDNYRTIKAEQKYGENSRIDFLLENENEKCYVEVKNVTLTDDKKTAIFPDSVTVRGQKHLVELMNQVKAGNRAVMLYVVQRQEAEYFDAARDIDPQYGALLEKALEAGVEIICCRTKTDGSSNIFIDTEIPFRRRN
jgi:sugar fermentation stimulation protein A